MKGSFGAETTVCQALSCKFLKVQAVTVRTRFPIWREGPGLAKGLMALHGCRRRPASLGPVPAASWGLGER